MSFKTIFLYICYTISIVATLGPPRPAPPILDYEDEKLFDGKPVVDPIDKYRNYRRKAGRRIQLNDFESVIVHPDSDERKDRDEDVVTGQSKNVIDYRAESVYDYTNKYDKEVILELVQDVFMDSENKLFMVGEIIDMHQRATSFEVGRVIGLIQAKMRHMFEIWREVSSKEIWFGYAPRTRIWPVAWHINYWSQVNGIWTPESPWSNWLGWGYGKMFARMNDYYILTYSFIYELEKDIEKLIEILNAIPRAELELPPITMRQSTTPKYYEATNGDSRAILNKKRQQEEAKAAAEGNEGVTIEGEQAGKGQVYDDLPKGQFDEGADEGGADEGGADEAVGQNDEGGDGGNGGGVAEAQYDTALNAGGDDAAEGEDRVDQAADTEDRKLRAALLRSRKIHMKGKTTKQRKTKWMPGGAGFRRHDGNLEEEKYKHRIRERYLLRKLGLNESGHTPKPRFFMGWPVEETWDNIPQY